MEPNNEFKDRYKAILEDKIYSPYFISKQTILQYQDEDNDVIQKESFMDIVESLFKNKININKLYLKFDMRDLRKLETKISQEYHEEIKHPIKE